MKHSLVLGRRAVRESLRTPDALFPSIFIPLFFLVVNVGQAAKIFPSKGTDFLFGQGYAAFQLPSSLLVSASFGGAALYLVEEIEGGYFDKLRSTPVPRISIILGRLYAELVKGVFLTSLIIAIAMVMGVRVKSGVAGFLVLTVLVSVWAMVFSGFMQLVALKTRNAAATQGAGMVFFPLMFLTPNFVPRSMLTRPMEIAATLNPVTYIMEAARSLILEGFDATALGRGFLVVLVSGALMAVLTVRAINRYD